MTTREKVVRREKQDPPSSVENCFLYYMGVIECRTCPRQTLHRRKSSVKQTVRPDIEKWHYKSQERWIILVAWMLDCCDLNDAPLTFYVRVWMSEKQCMYLQPDSSWIIILQQPDASFLWTEWGCQAASEQGTTGAIHTEHVTPHLIYPSGSKPQPDTFL